MKKITHKSILILLLLLSLSAILITSSSSNKKIVYQSRAAPVCDPQCQTEPPCCAEIISRYRALGGKPEDLEDLDDSEQPYHACPGLYDGNNERGYCRPETCNQLPAGLKYRGRCNWYWSFHEGATNSADGYGCMIGASESSMRPICGGSGGTPNPTNPPNTTLTPGGRGGGTLKVVVHIGTTNGAIWNSDEDIPRPYTDKKSLLIYINGPTARGSFGELLFVPGQDGEQCSSDTGFPYTCSKGTVEWKGDDGTSGTGAGSYSVSIAQAPKGWSIKDGSAQGSLASGSTLTIDLSLEQGGGGGPTATPNPNATATPTPDPNASATPKPTKGPKPSRTPTPSREPTDRINRGSSIGETIRNFFSSPTPGPGSSQNSETANQPNSPISINIPPVVGTVLNGVNTNASQALSVVGSLVRTIQNIDQTLENGINEAIGNIFGQ